MKALPDRMNVDALRQWLPLVTLVILVTVVGIMQPVFLQPSTLLQLASDTAVLFILATGVTFVIMLGGIDLSLQLFAWQRPRVATALRSAMVICTIFCSSCSMPHGSIFRRHHRP